jgi:F-type H+-transporting ATPase subunit a
VIIEVISHSARMLSLTVRLFANMFAGEQVYLTFIALTKVLIPVIFIGLHLFVSFLQAYIFMMLAMVYVGGAVSHEH